MSASLIESEFEVSKIYLTNYMSRIMSVSVSGKRPSQFIQVDEANKALKQQDHMRTTFNNMIAAINQKLRLENMRIPNKSYKTDLNGKTKSVFMYYKLKVHWCNITAQLEICKDEKSGDNIIVVKKTCNPLLQILRCERINSVSEGKERMGWRTHRKSRIIVAECFLTIADDKLDVDAVITRMPQWTSLSGNHIIEEEKNLKFEKRGFATLLIHLSFFMASCAKLPGGVIFPLLSNGASLGHFLVSALQPFFSAASSSLVAPMMIMSFMCAMLTSITRTPLGSVLILAFTASGVTPLSVLLPGVLLASYVSVWVSERLSKDTFFTYSE